MKIRDWLFSKKKQREKPEIIWLEETTSTNDEIRKLMLSNSQRMSVVVADYQRSGRGQAANRWESEAGKNLLFSIMTHPLMVPVRNQFLLSMAGGLALKEVLDGYTTEITLKWPNDVYWRDRKISGTLIETTLSAGHIKDCIFGIGLNVSCFQPLISIIRGLKTDNMVTFLHFIMRHFIIVMGSIPIVMWLQVRCLMPQS